MERALSMSACITHRGPDDHGTWTEPSAGLALGFRRLSIVDLSTLGHQPMASGSGRFTMVFNGEVYNHVELRAELLSAGWKFRGHSDTEVILASFERWGIASAVTRFVGMFAIAVWDAETRRLSLIRDRLGIKPIFYQLKDGTLLFASELKALMTAPEFDRSLDTDALGAYLRYLYVPAPQSIFAHTKKVLPGHVLTLAENATVVSDEPYWSLDAVATAGRANPFEGSEQDAIDELERLLTDAVKLRMRADVPMGALLSGGIDSTTVVALMQKSSVQPVRTFSIGFPGTPHDEMASAAQIANRLGTSHTQMPVTAQDALDAVPMLPRLFDEPFADPSQIPTYLVSKLARRDVTVAVSGDGGDELWAGYSRYIDGQPIIRRALTASPALRRFAAAGIDTVGSHTLAKGYGITSPLVAKPLRRRLVGDKARKLSHLLRQGSEASMYRSLLSAWQDPGSLLVAGVPAQSRVEELLDQRPDLPLLERMLLVDQQTYLADDLLSKLDRASMAVSLEARVPLLDHRVVEYSWRIPAHMKIRHGRGKWLLRQVLYRHVPAAEVDRPKVGFSVPIEDWLRGALRPWAESLLLGSRENSALLARPVERAWKDFLEGNSESGLALWTILMFRAWRAEWGAVMPSGAFGFTRVAAPAGTVPAASVPSIAVIVPFLNAMAFLPLTAPSVLAAARRVGSAEIVYVDNGSTDGSAEYLRALDSSIRVETVTGGTIAALRNEGAKRTDAAVLAFLDSDCAVEADYLETALATLEETGADATGSRVVLPSNVTWIDRVWHELHFVPRDREVQYINSGNFVVAREAFASAQGFREDLRTGEDAELGQRLWESGYRIWASPRVKAVHYGNAGSLLQFYRRMVWHGLGMFGTVTARRIDRPTAMMVLHIVATVLGLVVLADSSLELWQRVSAAIALQLLIPAATVAARVSQVGRAGGLVAGLALYWLYYWARIEALVRISLGSDRYYTK